MYATEEHKAYVRENLGVGVWEDGMEVFKRWLVTPPGGGAPGTVKLYWRIIKFASWLR